MKPLADDGLVTLLAIILCAAVIWLAELLLRKLAQFRGRLWYFNMEIKRSSGREKKRWKKKKRELLLTLIPFYSFLKKQKR